MPHVSYDLKNNETIPKLVLINTTTKHFSYPITNQYIVGTTERECVCTYAERGNHREIFVIFFPDTGTHVIFP